VFAATETRRAIELDHIHAVVMILVDAATPLGARYERWDATIVS
jgi:hypothetical protein